MKRTTIGILFAMGMACGAGLFDAPAPPPVQQVDWITLSRESQWMHPQWVSGSLPSGWTGQQSFTSNTVTALTGPTFLPYEGRAVYVNRITMSSDAGPMVVWAKINEAYRINAWTIVPQQFGFIPAGGGSVTWEFAGSLILNELRNTKFYARSASDINARVWATVDGVDVTADFNYAARHTLLVAGDSISWTFGNNRSPSMPSGRDLWAFRVRDRLADKGASVRLVNKAYGGSHALNQSVAIDEGYYDGIKYGLLIVSIGMNDAQTNGPSTYATEGEFKACLRKFVAQRDRSNPLASVVLCAPTQTTDASRTNKIGSVRSWVEDVANEYDTAKKVYFANLGNSFTNVAAYCDDGIHPQSPGHALIADTICEVVETTDFYTSVLRLSGGL